MLPDAPPVKELGRVGARHPGPQTCTARSDHGSRFALMRARMPALHTGTCTLLHAFGAIGCRANVHFRIASGGLGITGLDCACEFIHG